MAPPHRQSIYPSTSTSSLPQPTLSSSSLRQSSLSASAQSHKTRQLTHLHASLATLSAHLADTENLLRMTAVQADSLRGLGGWCGGLYVDFLACCLLLLQRAEYSGGEPWRREIDKKIECHRGLADRRKDTMRGKCLKRKSPKRRRLGDAGECRTQMGAQCEISVANVET